MRRLKYHSVYQKSCRLVGSIRAGRAHWLKRQKSNLATSQLLKWNIWFLFFLLVAINNAIFRQIFILFDFFIFWQKGFKVLKNTLQRFFFKHYFITISQHVHCSVQQDFIKYRSLLVTRQCTAGSTAVGFSLYTAYLGTIMYTSVFFQHKRKTKPTQ